MPIRTLIHHSVEIPNEYILEIWNDETGNKVTAYFNPVAIEVTGVKNWTGEVFQMFIQQNSDWVTVFDFLFK